MSLLEKKKITWICVDDGTLRNAYYLSSDGQVVSVKVCLDLHNRLLENRRRTGGI